MNLKKLALSLLAVAALWSCSKDDGPSTPTTKAPTISSFTPEQGPVGTLVTINGTNFGTTAAANTVKLGSTTATISGTPTATKLTITVPQGATSGKISVTVDGKTDTSTKTFTVTEPEPENVAPVIAAQTFEVIESIADTEAIGTVSATDENQDELTFSIIENDNNLFEITPEGVLSLAPGKNLNFAEQAQHVITVQVSDGKGGMDTAEVTIDVTEDQAPQSDNHVFEVEETIADDVVIGTVEAADPEQQTLVFSIKTNDNELFEITEDGDLSLAPGENLDYEAATLHEITVSISDGYNETEVTVTINVIDITSAEDPSTFVTKWVTAQPSDLVVIGLNGALSYDFTVDWGDGNVEDVVLTNGEESFSHEYAEADTYTVAIQGDFPIIRMDNSSTPQKLVGIQQWGSIQWQSMELAFYGCENLAEYTATDVPDLSNVGSMAQMFRNCTLFNGAIGDWDISTVTDISYVFMSTSFNQDLSNWNTEEVITMRATFHSTPFNKDISNWNTEKVENMRSMFAGTNFNQDISNWTTNAVTDMSYMFETAEAFNQDMSGWDTSEVTNMSFMFRNATSFDQDLGSWDISSLQNAFGMLGMLDNSGMSPENLSSTFIGWNNFVEQNNGPQDISLGVDNLTYCGNDALLAADNLFTDHGWQFVGNLGYQVDCN